ncbi:COG4695 Phage-related protein [uncultured Caudovirales phage]|uniref:COG4695 Phage-related protein n=1 Tax=uncultured Caudovirales phage TaxID=2100421 RepID=A0A6J5N728_9CAUD|nr:COG4695 Phage-related protein [uncultured Caudovirales phage]
MLNNLFESRAVSFQTIWGTGGDIEVLNQSGTVVNPETVFRVNAIFSAVSLISDTISTLPVDSYIRRDGARFAFRPRPAWVQQPDVDTTKEAFYGSLIVSMLLDGNGFVRVFRDGAGRVVNMTVLNPAKVEIRKDKVGGVTYIYEGEGKPLNKNELMHIPDVVRPGETRGISRVTALKDNFGLALALESYAARFFGQGASTQGIIEFPGNLTPEQAKQLVDGFDARHKGFRKSHKTGVLSGGAKYVNTSVENDKAQFIDSRRMAVEDVARAFNIPPHLLGLPGTNTYSSVEQNNIAFVTHTLRPIVQKLESAFTPLMANEPGGTTAFIKFTLDGLLRGDANSRFTAYSTGLQAGYLTINDIRRLEDLPPVDGGEIIRVPLASVNIDAAELVATDKRVNMAQKLVNSGYDPADVLSVMGLPPILHTGLPTVQLQPIAQIDPEDPEAVYEV